MPDILTADPGLQTADSSAPRALDDAYRQVRRFTEYLCETLETEDYVIQSMPDVSPTKWHLAHTSWFFETFILSEFVEGYQPFHPKYAFLFNSYYIQAGARHCRAQRGYLSRPTVADVYRYRAHVDDRMLALLAAADESVRARLAPLVEIGLHHEQQHQELLLTDIKHVLSVNPLRPAYRPARPEPDAGAPALGWVRFDEGIYEIGHDVPGFAYDNESPRHRQYLHPFELATRPATNREYLAFIDDGGYRRAELWLSMGWATVQAEDWTAPFYWEPDGDEWQYFTLGGMRPLDLDAPVSHLSLYEADAFARWSEARLPTEAEWEVASHGTPIRGNFVGSDFFRPVAAADGAAGALQQMFGDVWEWTRSQYEPYPGYQPPPGALGEYNGKFMCNQFVLRGGSCATSASHVRRTYRNFFPPEATWQFTGVRLARDVV